ncbi:MAG: hypothetical protein VX278_22890 [Myxococcota bacterium]|nr:hypothetical protein [Myxococcota bacterium]
MYFIRWCGISLCFACGSDKGITAYNTPPTAEITSHSQDSTFLVGEEVVFFGVVGDTNHSLPELSASWYIDTREICTDQSLEVSGEVSCTTSVSYGDQELRLQVLDPDGAAGVATLALNVQDSEPPVVEMLSPLENMPYYQGQLISFSAMISDAEDPSNALSSRWRSSLDGDLNLGTIPDSSGRIEDFSSLSVGEHVVTLTVTDTTDKFTVVNRVISVGDTNEEPSCLILSPVDGDYFASGDTVSFSAEATDAETPTEDLIVTWLSDSDGVLGTSNPSSTGEILFSHTGFSIGSHLITMRVEDDGGGECTDILLLNVQSPPNVSITSPVASSVYSEGNSIPFVGLVSDSFETPDQLALTWNSDVDGIFSSAPADASGVVSFSYGQLSAGSHTLTLQATNASGASDSDSVSISINGAPTAPMIVLAPSPAYTLDNLSVGASGSTDPEGDSITYIYEWYKNGVQTVHSSTLVPATETVKNEVWKVRVTPYDGLTLGGSTEDTVTIENSPPTTPAISITPVAPTAGVEDLTCTISGVSTDDDGDVLTYTFAWYDSAGTLQQISSASSSTSDIISGSVTTSGDWECEVYASDGQDDGTPAVATVTVSSTFSGCEGGSSLVSMAPSGTMVLCEDPNHTTCEQDFETFCPTGWHLCTHNEYNNRNDGWTQSIDTSSRALGVRYCRTSGGAGHFTVPDNTSSVSSLGTDEIHNCFFGTSRPECTSSYGCNETSAMALCCSDNPLCGNGVVDSVEEECDDGNNSDADTCLNVCDFRTPGGGGTNCGW